jgi:hypothetical protein
MSLLRKWLRAILPHGEDPWRIERNIKSYRNTVGRSETYSNNQHGNTKIRNTHQLLNELQALVSISVLVLCIKNET